MNFINTINQININNIIKIKRKDKHFKMRTIN